MIYYIVNNLNCLITLIKLHSFCTTAYARKIEMAALKSFRISVLIIGITLTRQTCQSPVVGGDGALKCSKEVLAKIKEGSGNSESEDVEYIEEVVEYAGENVIVRTFYKRLFLMQNHKSWIIRFKYLHIFA